MKRLRLPSVVQVGFAVGELLRRFPWTVFMAALGTGAAITLVESAAAAPDTPWPAIRVLLTALVGLPATLAAALLAEALNFSPARRRIVEGVVVLLAGCYFLYLPDAAEHATQAFYIRTALWVLGLHFVIAFVPAVTRAGEEEFWNFNWRLFLRFWLGALYSAVLFVGLIAAVASATRLFEVKIEPRRYFELWVVIVGLFNTCFVLRGVPRVGGAEAEGVNYPRGLNVFAQFALAPLVVAYLAILYPYAVKIIVSRTWPNGWVSLPILYLAVVGVLAALFLHPIRQTPNERWAGWYWRWFFRVLLPLTVLLFLAIHVRVGEYGITESRYFALALSVWLAGVSLYYWSPARQSIRWLPASLALICLLCTWGPWGAFRMSERSQFDRLTRTLSQHGLLVSGVLTPKRAALDKDDYADLQSMFSYLSERHDSAKLDRLLEPFYAATKGVSWHKRGARPERGWREAQAVMDWLGVAKGQGKSAGIRFSFTVRSVPGNLAGYSRATPWLNLNPWENKTGRAGSSTEPVLVLNRDGNLGVQEPKGLTELPGFAAGLAKTIAAFKPAAMPQTLPWEQASFPVTIHGRAYVLVVLDVSGETLVDGQIRIERISLLVLEK